MSRYLYSNLLKIVFCSILMVIFIPSFVYLTCSLIIDNYLNILSLMLSISCVMSWIIFSLIINKINKTAKNKIIFEDGKIQYKGRTIYMNDLSIKYFKFHISMVDPSIVVPKLHINGNNLSVTCYISKKDMRKIEELGFIIKKI